MAAVTVKMCMGPALNRRALVDAFVFDALVLSYPHIPIVESVHLIFLSPFQLNADNCRLTS